jgi:hypothetical protein
MASIFNQDIGLNYKGIITLGSTINQNLSGTLQYLTDGDGNNLPLQLATNLMAVDGGTIAFTTGTNTRNVLTQTYTVNNTGGTNTVRGIFLNATETAIVGTTHNLLDLQVGGVSQFKVGRDGRITTSNSYITFNNNTNVLFGVDAGGFLYYQGGNRFLVSTTGLIYGYNDLRNTGNIVAGGISITPLARLHVRGDGTNSIAIFETNAGASVLTVVNGGVLINTTLGFYCNFLYPASGNTIALEGKANLVASTISRASLSFRSGVAPTVPVNGDIWFDGTNLFMRIGGVTKTFTLTP